MLLDVLRSSDCQSTSFQVRRLEREGTIGDKHGNEELQERGEGKGQ
jgi:hypothetical protein